MIEVIADYGNVQRALKNYQKSEIALLEALEKSRKLYKTEHINIAIIMANLGLLYNELGDQMKMEHYLKQALTIFEKQLLPKHPYVAKTIKTLRTKKNAPNEMGYFTRILIA